MLCIRPDQVTTLSNAYMDRLAGSIAADLAERHPAARNSPTLHNDVVGWIEDATAFGLASERLIRRFVEGRFVNHYRRPPIAERVSGFLREEHPDLVLGIALEEFVEEVIALCGRANLNSDEAVAWLSVLLLSARAAGESQFAWAEEILMSTPGEGEQRLSRAHAHAAAQGWLQAA